MKYEVIAICIDDEGRPLPQSRVHNADEFGRRTEVIDTDTNRLFAHCAGPWDVEDTYEAFWNRLNPSWERNFPVGKDRAKVVLVREVV